MRIHERLIVDGAGVAAGVAQVGLAYTHILKSQYPSDFLYTVTIKRTFQNVAHLTPPIPAPSPVLRE